MRRTGPTNLRTAALLMAMAFAAWQGLGAQREAGPPQTLGGNQARSDLLRAETTLVLVEVRVWDKSGKVVTGLKQEEFRVFEDVRDSKSPPSALRTSRRSHRQPRRQLRRRPSTLADCHLAPTPRR